jgi:hypothetical protein
VELKDTKKIVGNLTTQLDGIFIIWAIKVALHNSSFNFLFTDTNQWLEETTKDLDDTKSKLVNTNVELTGHKI